MKRLMVAVTVLVLLLLSACANSSGSMSGIEASCQSSGEGGVCNLAIEEVSGGPIAQPVKSSTFKAGDETAEVTVRVSTESGALRVGLIGENGEQQTVEVQPGQPAEITGDAKILGVSEDRAFNVTFTAVDGEASGVEAEIQYEAR